jgi:hypothetical protein
MQFFLLFCIESKTWPLTQKEESGLRVFESRVLSKIFGLKNDEVRGECRRLHKEKYQDLHSSSNKIRLIQSRRIK